MIKDGPGRRYIVAVDLAPLHVAPRHTHLSRPRLEPVDALDAVKCNSDTAIELRACFHELLYTMNDMLEEGLGGIEFGSFAGEIYVELLKYFARFDDETGRMVLGKESHRRYPLD